MTQPRDVTSPRESANRFARGRSQPPHGTRGTRPRRALALLLAVLLVLQGALALGGRSADAAETQDGDSVYLTVGDVIWYGGNDAMGTARMSVNGEVAYCSDPANGTPKAGYYTREPVQTHAHGTSQWPVSAVEKVLFYGYGGPGFNKDLWRAGIGGTDAYGRSFQPGVNWDGSEITDDQFYVYTHILLSDRVTCNSGDALIGTTEEFRAWFCWNMLGYTYGKDGSLENPASVGSQINNLGVPSGFEAFQLDTGHNSMWQEGGRSQTIVTFEYNPFVEVRFDKVSADATLTSGNEEYAYSGATYDIYEADGDRKVTTITTDEGGHASCQLKPNTRYYAVEVAAPQGFVLSAERVEFSTGEDSSTVSLADTPGTLRLSVQKKDAATGGEPQVGATLEGAEYKVVDANGKAHLGTTDKSGLVTFDGLPFGAVSVTETKAPEGYRLDATKHEYYVSSAGMPASGVIEHAPIDDFAENVVAFDLNLVKYRDTGSEESGLQDPAEGVEFQIISGTTGEAVGAIITDENGYATTEGGWFGSGERPEGVSGALPYDRDGYVIREVASTTPEGCSPAPDWHVTSDQMVDGVTLHYIVDNDLVSTRIQVVKVDAATGQVVPLAGFTFQLLDEDGNTLPQDVWYPNHEQLTEFTTDGSGCVTFPGELTPGTYRIREVAAAAPYLTAGEDLVLTIEDTPELAPITVVSFFDNQATGSASIVKRCSTGGVESGSGMHDEGCAQTLAGAEFDVVATHDVMSPDGSVLAVNGEVVDHVVTGEDGIATAEGLPLGTGTATYAFVETKPAAGHALDATPYEFTLSYVDDHTPVVTASVEAVNEPTTATLDKAVLGTGAALPGATFALWREGAEDEDERVILTTDEAGTIAFRHLGTGTYHVAEMSAPDGYLVDGTTRTFTVDEAGLIEGSSHLELFVEDDFTRTLLSKRDITTEEEIPGAHLSVLDAEGNVVEQWVSGEEPHLIEALPVGVYTLVEELTPRTYDEATAVEFTVSPTGEVQSVVMYDEPITVTGEVDKRQEVADPAGGTYDYSVDFRSTSSTWVDEFTVTDDLTAATGGLAELTGITTPVGGEDYDDLLNVWYRTDLTPADHVDGSGANATLSDGHDNPWLHSEESAGQLGDDGRTLSYEGWKLWAQDLSTTEARELSVADLDLAEGEKVVAIRLEYGRVEAGFTTRTDDWDRADLKDVHDNVDDVATTHEGDQMDEEVDRAPLIVHMRLTDAYRGNAVLANEARVDLYRNGGGEGLEDHDSDRVEQTPGGGTLAKTGEAAAPIAGVATLGVASVLLSLRRRRR